MKYKYLIFGDAGFVWGKNQITKEYFVGAAQRGDIIVNVAEMQYFDKDKNAWVDIGGDE